VLPEALLPFQVPVHLSHRSRSTLLGFGCRVWKAGGVGQDAAAREIGGPSGSRVDAIDGPFVRGEGPVSIWRCGGSGWWWT
jgi:hypothetical protein